jgi:flagellar biosynthesis/type III secretory pathway protein FliH
MFKKKHYKDLVKEIIDKAQKAKTEEEISELENDIMSSFKDAYDAGYDEGHYGGVEEGQSEAVEKIEKFMRSI